jgi:hypothetical protein
MSLQYRQGDLLFVLQETRPKANLVVRAGLVILTGEATGHSHRLTEGQILEDPAGKLYLDLTATARVVHEEHAAITLGPGLWLVVRQREYTTTSIHPVYD